MSANSASSSPHPLPHHGVAVELRALSVRAGHRMLLENAAAHFEPGQVTLIVGCSGVGKTILLRIIAGLLGESHAEIGVTGEVLLGGRQAVTANGRQPGVGIVFQNYALFDEMSPADNVRFAGDHRAAQGTAGDDQDARAAPRSAEAWLAELGVPADVRTASLSGGQRQRLAIARTLAYDPDVILYDEPTSGLDAVTAGRVAALIAVTHAAHPKTSIVVTHDFEALAPIADRLYLLDGPTRRLIEIPREEWPRVRELLHPAADETPADASPRPRRAGRAGRLCRAGARFFAATTTAVEQALCVPFRLLPVWRSPRWGLRFLGHYLLLVAGPSAWVYLAVSGLIIGFVTTYFTFRYLPYAQYTKPLLIEELLQSMGFALYRIFVPVLSTILVAARCGAAVASDVGGKRYGQQIDALQTFGVRPAAYLQTPILYAFLAGTPLLNAIAYGAARVVSVATFTATHPDRGPDFWHLHYHRRLVVPEAWLYAGGGWLLAKLLVCAVGIGLIAYRQGVRPKYSSRDVSVGITGTILWTTLYVLLVHFVFAFFEFSPV